MGCARGDLVLRFGREIAGVMLFVQLFFKRPGGAVDHPPALDGRALVLTPSDSPVNRSACASPTSRGDGFGQQRANDSTNSD